MKKLVTRRELLGLIAATGTSSTVFAASAALGLIPDTQVSIPQIPSVGSANRPTVAILGAGISGLIVAYELKKAGYECVVLEASPKAGGRVMTVRAGDIIDEVGNPQRVEFDDEPHMYFNAGAARIPSSHRNILHYCKELGVEMEVFINENKETWIQDDAMLGGKRVKNTEFTTSARGFMAEILAKNFDRHELNQPLTEREAETLLNAMRSFGDLSEGDLYKGSFRAGYRSGGYIEHGVQKDIIALSELLKSRFMGSVLSANEGDTGPILFQAKGGMDKIAQAFVRHLEGNIHYNVIVSSVQLAEDKVNISYENRGSRHSLVTDYCFNCIPTHLMSGIDNNFPAEYIKAMNFPRRGTAYKSAFQAKTRFWEKEDIYGGISWTNQTMRQIWYPTHGMHKAKGVILSAYDYGNGMPFTELSQEQRLETVLRQGEKLHPGYRQLVEKGITVAWHRMNHMLGCSARWGRGDNMSQEAESLYHTLQQPAGGRHYAIGDQVSTHSAWQESAVLSAHWAIDDLVGRQISSSALPA